MASRRQSGSVRRLPSGRWQARIRDPLTNELLSIGIFRTKAGADQALALAVADQTRGSWVDPRRSRVTLSDYATFWLRTRPKPLSPRTLELYEGLLRLHVLPVLGSVELGRLSTSGVRSWHSELVSGKTGVITAAKAYRLLRAILATAVEDELIAKNPCTIRGAGEEHSPERSVASVAEVYALAEAVEPRFRALILTAAFTSMRQGELFGLRRLNLDLLHATISITHQIQTLRDGRLEVLVPKSKAGIRTVCLPRCSSPIEVHIAAYVGPEADDLVFTGAKGAPLRRNHWNLKWRAAARAAGLDHLRFHDLRHTGNTLAAATGASTKELMIRMGHASPEPL